MNCSLRLLLCLRAKATLRTLLRQVKRPAGALVAVAFGALIAFPGFVFVTEEFLLDARLVAILLPPVLLVLLLSICHQNGFLGLNAFGPGEIDFLFPAPFLRRQLVVYKLTLDIFFFLCAALFLTFIFYGTLGGLARAFLFSLNTLLIAQCLVFFSFKSLIFRPASRPGCPDFSGGCF